MCSACVGLFVYSSIYTRRQAAECARRLVNRRMPPFVSVSLPPFTACKEHTGHIACTAECKSGAQLAKMPQWTASAYDGGQPQTRAVLDEHALCCASHQCSVRTEAAPARPTNLDPRPASGASRIETRIERVGPVRGGVPWAALQAGQRGSGTRQRGSVAAQQPKKGGVGRQSRVEAVDWAKQAAAVFALSASEKRALSP